jgi:thermitase
VVVGHPDTGYTPHPEIIHSHLRPRDGYDYQDDDPDSLDPLPGRLLGFRHPGHGTSTSSLIISGQGLQPGSHAPAFVSGIAPGAALIPIRTTKSVLLWSMSRLTRAVRHAVSHGAHVISISLGGPVPSVALHSAMRDAEKAGVIVLCAAGNQVRFVVFPAAFDEVIAVAASRIDNTEWPGSCRGPAVDITAPGSSVWRAKTEKKGSGKLDFTVERGSGTSYAVAQTAGLAALWLSYHGRQNLIDRYRKERLSSVFKRLLQKTCHAPKGWDTSDFGPGIADAYALLRASLPTDPPARGLRGIRRRAVSDGNSLDVLVHQLAPAPRSGVTKAVASLLNVSEASLDDALDDVGAELVMRVGVDSTLRDRLRSAASKSSSGRSARARTATVTARRRVAARDASPRLRKYVKGLGQPR